MEIVICGRNVEVPEHFRERTAEKLDRLGRYDHKVVRLEVELSHEPNPRRSKSCQRVEITGRRRGPVVRGEGCAADFYSALDQALARIEERLRRSHDRRCVRRGRRQPISVAQTAGGVAVLEKTDEEADEPTDELIAEPTDEQALEETAGFAAVPAAREAPDDLDAPDDERFEPLAPPGTIARRKEHYAVPMSVDDALSQMELVGHDFFLFSDAETGRPSVVYRRRGYDYGVIALV